MIIVSQDRERIVNFNNICRIDVNDWKENCFTIDCFDVSDFECMLGRYETEERAKEVLQEIVILFKDEEMFHIRKSTLNNLDELAEPKYILKPVSRPKVYEMPLE